MITCIIGTRAQIIKMAPVIRELERRKIPFNLVLTGQHRETIAGLLQDFDIKTKPKYVCRESEVTSVLHAALWAVKVLFGLVAGKKYFFGVNEPTPSVIIVHGDTISTLIGALVGSLLGIKVAHVESGLRSFRLFHPFPEEIIRLLTFKLTDIAFCPGDWACGNMQGYRLEIVNTRQNTLLDSMRYALKTEGLKDNEAKKNYGIVSIHRFENIYNRRRLEYITRVVAKVSEQYPLIFVLHPATRKRLIKYNLSDYLESLANTKLVPRMGYVDFIKLIRSSEFVITDGGSNQEELSYLGIPTLIMRKATERMEGLKDTVAICNYDDSEVDHFFADIKNRKRLARKEIHNSHETPSTIIVDRLVAYLETDK